MAKSKNAVLKKLMKSLPDGSVFTLDEEPGYEVISSGISTIDYASGIGGFARGWQTMLYGPASCGKSALVLQAIGNYQKSHPDSMSAIIDLENSMSLDWAVKFGINPENLVILKPTNVEEMITMSVEAVKASVFDFIMVDSLGAGLLQTELDNDKSRMAGSAGAITRMVKAINSGFISLQRDIKVAKDSGDDTEFIVPAVILINQVRVDMGSMYAGALSFSGGKALEHMCGAIIRLRVSKAAGDKIMGTVDGNQLRVGWMCTATFEKNKLAVPYKSAGYTFVYKGCDEWPFGIQNARSTADLALSTGVARVEGKTIYYPLPDGTEGKIVGRNKFVDLIIENEDIMNFLSEEITRIMSDEIRDDDVEIVKENNKD